jgi:ATP/maltotriose-dependent transcriptional regulator MalT
VLELLQTGRSNAEIAQALHVSIETVRSHARRIYRKLGVSTRRELRARG